MPLVPSRIRTGFQFSLVTVACFGCSGSEANHLEAANRYFTERQYSKAVAEYSAAPALVAKNPAAGRQLGLSYNALGEWAQAIKYLEPTRVSAPLDTTVRLALGGAYLALARWDDATHEADAIMKTAPNNLTALNLAGSAYLGKGQPEKALPYYRQIARIAPGDPRGKYLVGMGLQAQGDTKGAAAQFEAAIAQLPTYLDPLTQIVTADLVQKRSGDALARVQQQIKVVGDSAALHELLALIHIARNEQGLAETTLLETMKLSPKYLDPYVRLSELYRSQGKYDDAIAIAAKALQLDPKNLSVRLVLGVSYEAKGDTTAAVKTYEDGLAVNPRFAAAANNLAALLAESGGDMDRALHAAESARAAEPNNPAILDTFGWVLFKRGDNVNAVRALSEAASRMPAQPTVAYHLGVAQAKGGDAAGARKSLRQALSSSAPFPERSMAQIALSALK